MEEMHDLKKEKRRQNHQFSNIFFVLTFLTSGDHFITPPEYPPQTYSQIYHTILERGRCG